MRLLLYQILRLNWKTALFQNEVSCLLSNIKPNSVYTEAFTKELMLSCIPKHVSQNTLQVQWKKNNNDEKVTQEDNFVDNKCTLETILRNFE